MWWKVWQHDEMECIIVRAETGDEALEKGRKYDQSFSSFQPFDPSWDVERLKMERKRKR